MNSHNIDEVNMTMAVDLVDDDDNDYVADVPIKFEVCHRCDGRGRHVNPSIDGDGITREEWDNDWDDESREMYLSGGYDVTCYECNGKRVVPEVDEYRCEPTVLSHYRKYQRALDRSRREREAEIKFGY